MKIVFPQAKTHPGNLLSSCLLGASSKLVEFAVSTGNSFSNHHSHSSRRKFWPSGLWTEPLILPLSRQCLSSLFSYCSFQRLHTHSSSPNASLSPAGKPGAKRGREEEGAEGGSQGKSQKKEGEVSASQPQPPQAEGGAALAVKR